MSPARALILHDDPRTVALARSVVEGEGFETSAAETPWKLVELPPDAPPDLVLLGVTAMDERDLELVGVVRRRCPRATLLVLFPGLLRERAARALELGADGYLPEPFYPGELAVLARNAASRAPQGGAAPAGLPAPQVPVEAAPDDASLAKLAAGVAHSIRNPLQIVELQLAGYEADGALDLPRLREQLARIAGVAESLTRFSSRRKISPRVVDLNAVVQMVFGDAARRTRPVRVAAAAGRLEVLGAPDLLRAALEAIHDRAQRVTQPGGEIVVATSLAGDAGAPLAEVVVTDAGPALAAGQLASFFDPFPDADHVTEGTGMEMAAAAGIVRTHGGSVSARPGAASGTSVVIRLPARGRAGARGPLEDS